MTMNYLESKFQALVESFLSGRISAFSYMREAIRLGRQMRAAQEA